ncbi:MAG: hypothetical protein DHS20C21_22500 [Gemmatimonadota bacterium]|nr:MAG: hypothetical protein DHS20C21_22500 [Gemmatimonadota bacterium]
MNSPTARALPPLALILILATAPSFASDAPDFNDAFWKQWGDGQAELSSYDLTFPRYGQLRSGTAITVFVTETFSQEARVKADPGRHAEADQYPVMKLNLMQDFPTGIYDYNVMTSAFYAITSRQGRPAGSPTKVAFSSQEWCGHAFHELLPGVRDVRSVSHSYFDGEGDQTRDLPYPPNSLFEDGLLHWARGWATPVLKPGESRTVPLLRSTEFVRFRHVPLMWEDAVLHRSEAKQTITVPGGTFEVETLEVTVQGDEARRWTFQVEAAAPRRIVRWETDEGRRAELVKSDRMKYWAMNGPEFVDQVSRLGLSPRPARTP